jgi:hypothetical protein
VISIAVVKREVIDLMDFFIIVTPFIGGGFFFSG